MRSLFFVLSLVVSSVAHSASSIVGILQKEATGTYLRVDSACDRYVFAAIFDGRLSQCSQACQW